MKRKPNPYRKLQYEIEKALNATIERKFRTMRLDINNLILGLSNQGHSRNITQTSNHLWKSLGSDTQAFTTLGSAIQKAILRNL